ncbi:TolC family outer membrane protein [Roseateles sp. BYS180W]|uniref:TolC family outer membrane protein n=1 Tax=Roseateles rivi TaxID=3299028 RepID=A0ABW7FV69_9BURK
MIPNSANGVRGRRPSGPGKLLWAMVVAGVLGGMQVGAQAQSLKELYEAALAYDASYLAALAQASAAPHRAAQTQALARPTLGLSTSATRSESDPPGSLPRDRVGSTVLQTGLQARMSLFNRANAVSIEQAQRSLEVAQLDVAQAEQDLIVRVAQAYFDVLAAQDALATTQASKKAIGEQLASAKRNFEVGTATITDTREAQSRFDLATAQEIKADNDLRVAQVTLDQLVGRSGVQPKPLAQPVGLPAVPPGDVQAWVERADAEHPAVRKAQIGLEVAELEVSKAKAGHLPTVDLSSTLGAQRLSGSQYVAAQRGTTPSASLGVTVTLPVYSGGAVDARTRETLALQEKSRQDLVATRRQVSEGTRRTFFGVQSLLAQVRAYEAAEASTKLALESTQLGYKVGVRVNLDVLNAQTQLYTTQRDLARARYDVLLNALKLRQAAGALTAEHVAALNELLAP